MVLYKLFNGTLFLMKLSFLTFAIHALATEKTRSQIPENLFSSLMVIRPYLYFTNIALVYTLFCIFLGFMSSKIKRLNPIYEFTLVTAIVLESMVSFCFWILYSIDPGLVKEKWALPTSFIRECPKHLFPLITLLIEQRNKQFLKSMGHRYFIMIFCVFYYFVIELYSHYSKDFIYPFLKAINIFGRSAVFSGFILIALLIYEFWMRLHFQIIQKRSGAIRYKVE